MRNTNSSYIYTSQYSVLKDKILEWNSQLSRTFELIEGVGIRKHVCLDEDIIKTEYKNGVAIYINYSQDEYVYRDIVIPALSYTLVE